MTTRTTDSPLSYVYDGKQCIGFIMSCGRLGYRGYDRDERPLGIFKTAAAAANAVFNVAASDGGNTCS
jgi:hypothetical protein